MGLRPIATTTTVSLAILAVGVSAALVLLTTNLRHATVFLRRSMASVRLAEEAEINLLVHDRALDHAIRSSIEDDLRQGLLDARIHVTSHAEQSALDEATAAVTRYLEAHQDENMVAADRARYLDSSYRALRKLVRINVAQADAVQQTTLSLDKLGALIGASASVIMLTGLGCVLWWIRRAVLRPLFAVASTVERFGKGDLEARVSEDGATELRDIARRFNIMAEALARQRQGRLTYLAGIAHDLRNPLSALQMSTAVISPERALPSEEQLRRVLALVRRQVTRLNRMVGDLLETAQIEAGNLTLKLEEHDLRQIVHTVVELFEGTSSSHEVNVDLPDEPILVRCDALRIEQTLGNLISNALKYSPGGGEVHIEAQATHDYATLSVTDHGIGIAPEDLEHLWEPFRRAGTATSEIPGVGLGLSIAKRIIEAHGGAISVRSTAGVGSTFLLVLPLAGSPHGHGQRPSTGKRPRS